jgi:preprotein translocase subunit SecG
VGFISVILYIVFVLVCLFLIMVVLLQQGKGADLAGAFGGGGSQTSFGPRTSTNIMHRLTTISFVLFVVLAVTLAVRSGLERSDSVVTGVEQETAAEETATEPGEPAEGESLAAEPAAEQAPDETAAQDETAVQDETSQTVPADQPAAETQPEPGT